MSRYDDIINLPHPDLNHPRMSMEKRAAQFAPFSALSGHGEAISETARQTESMIELTAEEQSKLSKQLIYALERGMEVKIIHFKPDVAKEGGRYESTKGIIKRIVEEEQLLILRGGTTIPLHYIIGVRNVR